MNPAIDSGAEEPLGLATGAQGSRDRRIEGERLECDVGIAYSNVRRGQSGLVSSRRQRFEKERLPGSEVSPEKTNAA